MRTRRNKGISALLHALIFTSFPSTNVHAQADEPIKSIFLFKDVLQSNTTALMTSGFDTVIIFRIGVLDNGDLVYYSTGDTGEAVDTPVVTKGEYVGGGVLAEKIQSFKKTGTTTTKANNHSIINNSSNINRVEISLVSHDATFQNIKTLVTNNEAGPTSLLYRGFQLLKTQWHLDAFNNDDESVYDVASTVSFAQTLGSIGYQYSIAPYTNTAFWTTVKRRIDAHSPGLLDRVYLQVYDGGAGNDPWTWQLALGGMAVVPLVWVVNDAKPSQGVTPAQARARFLGWDAQHRVAGGGYWNDYDIEKMGSSYEEYAKALTDVFA